MYLFIAVCVFIAILSTPCVARAVRKCSRQAETDTLETEILMKWIHIKDHKLLGTGDHEPPTAPNSPEELKKEGLTIPVLRRETPQDYDWHYPNIAEDSQFIDDLLDKFHAD
jgi:hypothetical protein